LVALIGFWEKDNLIDGALVDVHYTTVVAKSNRISEIFCAGEKQKSNDSIVGARFIDADTQKPKHIITHYITTSIIKDSVSKLELCKKILSTEYGGTIKHDDITKIKSKDISLRSMVLARRRS
jgi:hypothetical protein